MDIKNILAGSNSFTKDLVRLNALDLVKWEFPAGALFGSAEKWWAEKSFRAKKHNGLDLRFYETRAGEIKALDGKTKIPLLRAGRILKIIPDFLGSSIFAGHDILEAGRRLFTIYGHMAPDAGIEGKRLEAGSVIGQLSENKKKTVPPHLHISIALIPESMSVKDLSWETLDESGKVFFLDPAEVIY